MFATTALEEGLYTDYKCTMHQLIDKWKRFRKSYCKSKVMFAASRGVELLQLIIYQLTRDKLMEKLCVSHIVKVRLCLP